MSAVERLDRFQRRHRWSGFPIAVVYKFADDQGAYLAALITYYGFLSLFPLLLLLSTALGYVLQNDPELRERILESTISQFPVIGDQLGTPEGLRASGIGLVVGLLVSLYGGLGVGQALQNAMNVAWAVPRNERPNPLTLRLRSLILLGTVGLAVLGTTVLAAIGSSAAEFGADVQTMSRVLLTLAAVVVNTGVFILAFRIATARRLTLSEVVPGAVGAALAWQLLQLGGTAYVGRIVKGSDATYGVFALVLGLIAFIYVEAVVVVLCVEVNVVRSAHLYPRALLTPFTDDVDLTDADERAYTGYAEAQRNKGFQTVDVGFDGPDEDDEQSTHGHQTPPEPTRP